MTRPQCDTAGCAERAQGATARLSLPELAPFCRVCREAARRRIERGEDSGHVVADLRQRGVRAWAGACCWCGRTGGRGVLVRCVGGMECRPGAGCATTRRGRRAA